MRFWSRADKMLQYILIVHFTNMSQRICQSPKDRNKLRNVASTLRFLNATRSAQPQYKENQKVQNIKSVQKINHNL